MSYPKIKDPKIEDHFVSVLQAFFERATFQFWKDRGLRRGGIFEARHFKEAQRVLRLDKYPNSREYPVLYGRRDSMMRDVLIRTKGSLVYFEKAWTAKVLPYQFYESNWRISVFDPGPRPVLIQSTPHYFLLLLPEVLGGAEADRSRWEDRIQIPLKVPFFLRPLFESFGDDQFLAELGYYRVQLDRDRSFYASEYWCRVYRFLDTCIERFGPVDIMREPEENVPFANLGGFWFTLPLRRIDVIETPPDAPVYETFVEIPPRWFKNMLCPEAECGAAILHGLIHALHELNLLKNADLLEKISPEFEG